MTSPLTPEALANLERLEKEGTFGPWYANLAHGQVENDDRECVAQMHGIGITRNAKLIAEARNALPALLASAREHLRIASALEFVAKCPDNMDLWHEETGFFAADPWQDGGQSHPTPQVALFEFATARGWVDPFAPADPTPSKETK